MTSLAVRTFHDQREDHDSGKIHTTDARQKKQTVKRLAMLIHEALESRSPPTPRIRLLPLRKIGQSPAHDASKIRLGSGFDSPGQSRTLRIGEQRRLAGSLAIDQALSAFRVDAHHPVAHDLQAHTANLLRHGAAGVVVNRRKHQQPPCLSSVTARPHKPAQIIRRTVRTKLDRC